MIPCRACDHPFEGHGIRYAAIVGVHEWIDPGEPPAQVVSDRAVMVAGDDPCPVEVAHAATRRAVDHPDGGITYPLDPSRAELPAELHPDPAEAFQREVIRKHPFLGPALDQAARDLQKQERPSIFRRILNATRKASTWPR